MSNEFDFGTGEQAGADQADDSSAELSELALGPEKSTAGRNTAVLLSAFAAIGAAAIYFMRIKTGPAGAQAAPPTVREAERTLGQFMKDGANSRDELEKLWKGTAKLVEQFKDLHNRVVQVPIKNNPFQLKEPEQVDEHEAEEMRKREEQRRLELARKKAENDARIDAQKLRLSFIMGGSKGRTCMINGVAYRVGGVVDGFVIREIDHDRVIVAKELPGGAPEFTYELKAGR